MCLLAIAWKRHPRWRLLLAGNRDEFHGRPTAPLSRWPQTITGILAGRDLQSGGTWAGIDARGRCAVVTNVRDPRAPLPDGPSRGGLPLEFLAGQADAARYVDGLRADTIDRAPFNLLAMDDAACWHLGNHPRMQASALPAGLHAMSNGPLDAPWPKTRRLSGALSAWMDSGTEDLAPLWHALASEEVAADGELPDTGVGIDLERRLSPAFIRGSEYGTRASTLIAIDYHGHGWIHERRFGPDGVFLGETRLENVT